MAAPIHTLTIADASDALSGTEQRYAHHLAHAAWYSARIILRQTSPEAPVIFDFILALHAACQGQWESLCEKAEINAEELSAFLDYAGTFLSNIGNYHGSGDHKFVPQVGEQVVASLAGSSEVTQHLYSLCKEPLLALPPYSLGFPSEKAQSTYYQGEAPFTREEITEVSSLLEQQSILLENTRLSKSMQHGQPVIDVNQASIEVDECPMYLGRLDDDTRVQLVRGDHAETLARINDELSKALQCYEDNHERQKSISKNIESFRTGNLNTYKEGLQAWVLDKSPPVENIFGFVEPYRDPLGARAEFEGIVAISDPEQTAVLSRFVQCSHDFIKSLPWIPSAAREEGDTSLGPFEKDIFEPPAFTSINSLAYVSSYVFEGINLPNYNDIRQNQGFKKVIIANRMAVEGDDTNVSPYVHSSEATQYQKHKYHAYYLSVVIHELLGHGTSRLLMENGDGTANFDRSDLPISPLTGKPITTWYHPGQTWTRQFGDLAATVDECRAELVASYLIDDAKLLGLFGFSDQTDIKADDVTYNKYQQLGEDGLRSLGDYNQHTGTWGRAHSQAHFATLKWLLRDGAGFLTIEHDKVDRRLTVTVDRSRTLTDGKASLGRLLLRLHVYRYTAAEQACRMLYEDLSRVDGEYLAWRAIVISQQAPKRKYVQSNTFLDNSGKVSIREYPPTNEGIIQSWVDRAV